MPRRRIQPPTDDAPEKASASAIGPVRQIALSWIHGPVRCV
jgi:hypothetical protein